MMCVIRSTGDLKSFGPMGFMLLIILDVNTQIIHQAPLIQMDQNWRKNVVLIIGALNLLIT